jgi:hypothetical protein
MLIPFILEGDLDPNPTVLDYQNCYYGYDRTFNTGFPFAKLSVGEISNVYIEEDGRDWSLCGDIEFPCKTIQYSCEVRCKIDGEEEGKVYFDI